MGLFASLVTKIFQAECKGLSAYELVVNLINKRYIFQALCPLLITTFLISTLCRRVNSTKKKCSGFLRQQGLRPVERLKTALYFLARREKSGKLREALALLVSY